MTRSSPDIASAIDAARLSLVAAAVGSCTCNTKSPNMAYHDASCRALKIASALDDLDTIASVARSSAGNATVRPLDWLETFTDRGDGSQDHAGWEADSGFGPWYNVVAYFGSDSLGWEVSYDAVKIADHDDPEQAKKSAQAHFEKAVRAALQSPNVAQASPPPYADWRESIGIILYNCEKFRAVHAGNVLSAAAGKPITGADMEPWEECCETFLSDADAVIDFLKASSIPSTARETPPVMRELTPEEAAELRDAITITSPQSETGKCT